MVKLLLEKGANITARDRFDRTSLHVAALFNNTEVVELLLANGAPIEAKARHDNDMSSNPYEAYVPEDEQPSETPLFLVSDRNNYGVAKLLLEKGANVSARNGEGKTPLHRAVLTNQTSIVELLLAKGADINAVDDDGNTPLHWAALSPGATSELLEFLLTRPENATSTDLYGFKFVLAMNGKVKSGSSRLELLVDGLKSTNDGTRPVGKCEIRYHFFKHWFFGK
jgi:ankyrin repeat protein